VFFDYNNCYFVFFFANSPMDSTALRISIGNIQTVVFDWSELMSLTDCSVLRCSAPGALANISAAFLRFSDANSSPSDVIILDLFSLSASACFQIVLLRSCGIIISLSSTERTLTHRTSDFLSTISLILVLASALLTRSWSSSNCHTIFLMVV